MSANKTLAERLEMCFPDKVVYEPEVSKEYIYRLLFKEAKSNGMRVGNYVKQLGFSWKTVERCMDYAPCHISMEQPIEHIVTEIFQTQPLLGDLILPDPCKEELYRCAREIFNKAFVQKKRISLAEKKILLLETIYIVQEKYGDTKQDQQEENKSFWAHIFCEYIGHTVSSTSTTYAKIYAFFCSLITEVLDKTNHMRIPDAINGKKKHQYYDTLLIHAQAPKEDLNNFFRILFDFYVNAMDCQYIPNDSIYKNLVRALRARQNENIEAQVAIRSDSITAASYALLAQCPWYGYQYCEELIRKIDFITKDGDIGAKDSELNIETSYLDRALYTWYQHQSVQTRAEARQKRNANRGECLITETKRIHANYQMQGDTVKIVLPKIRFDTEQCDRIEEGGKPTITVFCDDEIVVAEALSYFGRQGIYTSRAYTYDLSQNSPQSLNYRVRVTIETEEGPEVVYDSDQSASGMTLRRDALIFNALQDEIPAIYPGIIEQLTIFIPLNSEYCVDGEDGCIEQDFCRFAQKLLVYPIKLHALTVGQKDLYVDRVARNRFRLKPSNTREDTYWMHNNIPYEIYSGPTEFIITIPEGKHIEEYQIFLHHQVEPLAKYYDGSEVLLRAEEHAGLQEVRITEVNTGRTVFELNYAILSGFQVELDRMLYFDEEKEVSVTIHANGTETLRATVDSHQGENYVEIPYVNGDMLRVPLPVFCARFMDRNLSEFDGQLLWWQDIAMEHMFTFSTPDGWTPHLWIGNSEITQSQKGNIFEVGNYLVTYPKEDKIQEKLTFRLESEGQRPILKNLAEIVLRPKIIGNPLTLEDETLRWEIDGLYKGPQVDAFYLSLQVHTDEEPWLYQLKTTNEVVEKKISLEDGKYPYEVYIIENHFFKKTKRIIYSGELIFGDPNALRFKNADILLLSASCLNYVTDEYETVPLHQGNLRIVPIRYEGCDLEYSEENGICPHYIGILQFWNYQKNRWYDFNNSEERKDQYEVINPIDFWIISNHFLSFYEPSKDAVCVDSGRGSIIGKSQDNLTALERKNAKIPDKFEYVVRYR